MKTSLGRKLVIGPYISTEDYEWTLIAQIETRPTRMWFETSQGQLLGFDTPNPAVDRTLDLPARPTHRRGPYPNDVFHFQEAEISGLRAVRPCRYNKAVTGLLLEYDDGHREAVGMVHLKRLEPTLLMGEELQFWISFRLARQENEYPSLLAGQNTPKKEEYCFASGVTLEEPKGEEYRICVKGSGLLQWWTSWRQIHVIFEGQKTPDLRLG